MMRIAKFLATAGVASRRAAEELVRAGAISVDGVTITNVATNIDPALSEVRVRGKVVSAERLVYYLVHKPAGYLSAAKAASGAKLVTQLVPKNPRVYPVGRLDKDSSGLIILTNDGALTLQLTHPKFEVAKVYEVELDHLCTPDLIRRLMKGVRMKEGKAFADAVERITARKIRITLHQGFNRQIRRMLGFCGYTAVSLKRISEGFLTLGELGEGKYRVLRKEDILK